MTIRYFNIILVLVMSLSSKDFKLTLLTAKDLATLESIKPIVDGIAALLGENCEVLLHSLENLDRSIVHIANGHITGRSVGSPITDLGMKVLREATSGNKDVVGSYYSKTADGKTLRSVTVLIRNEKKKPIGFLCINFNMSAPILSILKSFDLPAAQTETPENFATNIEELIQTTLHDAIISINSHKAIPNLSKNKIIVNELDKKGIFSIRGAIDIVARELSVSRYTIYNYLRENKFSRKKEAV